MPTALPMIDEMGLVSMFREFYRGFHRFTTNKDIRDRTELLGGDEILVAAIPVRHPHRALGPLQFRDPEKFLRLEPSRT